MSCKATAIISRIYCCHWEHYKKKRKSFPPDPPNFSLPFARKSDKVKDNFNEKIYEWVGRTADNGKCGIFFNLELVRTLKLHKQTHSQASKSGTMARMSNDMSTGRNSMWSVRQFSFCVVSQRKGVKAEQLELEDPFSGLKERLIIAACRREIIHSMLLCMFIQSSFGEITGIWKILTPLRVSRMKES
jgi:hypothetical protein